MYLLRQPSQIEKELFLLLSPKSFKPLRLCSGKDEKKLLSRILTLPVWWRHLPTSQWQLGTHLIAKPMIKLGVTNEGERLPVGELLIFDLGFFKFPWFDGFTATNKFFVTRLREKTAYTVNCCLSSGQFYRDEIITMGDLPF